MLMSPMTSRHSNGKSCCRNCAGGHAFGQRPGPQFWRFASTQATARREQQDRRESGQWR
jgi:hypothetical protein